MATAPSSSPEIHDPPNQGLRGLLPEERKQWRPEMPLEAVVFEACTFTRGEPCRVWFWCCEEPQLDTTTATVVLAFMVSFEGNWPRGLLERITGEAISSDFQRSVGDCALDSPSFSL